ncbi:VWA domain-containing protein [soil metagenome]
MDRLIGFSHALRAAGIPVTTDRTSGFLRACTLTGLTPRGVYAAGRATLCSSPRELARFDQVFAAWFGPGAIPVARAAKDSGPGPGGGFDGQGADREETSGMATDAERLRFRDVARLSTGEQRRLRALFETLHPVSPMRRTGRHHRHHRGQLDLAATLRASQRRWGEPAPIQMRRRRPAPRTVVLLIDVSGSMSGYADALLRLAHRMRTTMDQVEVFTVGTRLTRITDALAQPDPERALAAAGRVVPDWSGGTRLGESLEVFGRRRRELARGAVVVVASDGWERGDPSLLGESMALLHRLAATTVWVNPHSGKVGYAPTQRGIRTVLPYVDHFVAGHSLATFADLLEVVGHA